MKIGFYAPLKRPDHPTPSGDRRIARLLIEALERCGHSVEVISQLRSWEGHGNTAEQEHIRRQGMREVERLSSHYNRKNSPDVLFTYHVYHKAPDWIGPELSRRLDVPYIVSELSIAPKQDGGQWDAGYHQSLHCLYSAHTVIHFNSEDEECVLPLLSQGQHAELVKPFLRKGAPRAADAVVTRERLAHEHTLDPDRIWLFTAAMMRFGDKQASYESLADSLGCVSDSNIQVIIAGDGEARPRVESVFSKLDLPCCFTGELDPEMIQPWMESADIYAWPSVNEAYGMALLEAVSCGLPVVAQDYGGVSMLIDQNVNGILVPRNDNAGYAHAIDKLASDDELRRQMSLQATRKFREDHEFEVAADALSRIIDQSVGEAK